MSSSRCSKALVVALLVLVASVGMAAAVSTETQGVPAEAEVGEEVTATYTFTELYSDFESWTLHGETNLTTVTWTVKQEDQAGNQLSQNSSDGATFNESVNIEDDTARVVVTVRGTVPEVGNFTYDPRDEFLLASYELVRDGGTRQAITEDRTHHYTNESQQARQEIEQARSTIEDAGGDQQAEETLQNAISAYEAENFENAVDLADRAQEQAEQKQSTQSRNRLLMYGGAGLLALLVVVGGVYYWRSQQDDYDKLR
jgi:hypothetical protein